MKKKKKKKRDEEEDRCRLSTGTKEPFFLLELAV